MKKVRIEPFRHRRGPVFYDASLVRSQTSHSSGSWYFEMTVNTAINIGRIGVGIDDNRESLTLQAGRAGSICWVGNGDVNYNANLLAYSTSTFSIGDTLGVDTDLTGGTIRFRRNGDSFSSNFSISAIIGGQMYALAQLANAGDAVTSNFTGPFAFTAPSTAWG